MKVKIFVVTYKNEKILNDWFLKSLQESTYPKDSVKLEILNNYSNNLFIDQKYIHIVNFVHHNTVRLDCSTGHLARDWNHGFMNAFIDLTKPKNDAAMLLQNDTILLPNWYEKLCFVMKKYDFVTYGAGDQCQIVNAKCIKKIGIYDERFCNIACQAGDFILRNLLYNPLRTSINDRYHGRWHNEEKNHIPIKETPTGAQRKDVNNITANTHTDVSLNFWDEKWKIIKPCFWEKDSWGTRKLVLESGAPFVKTHILYPYFEKDIERKVYKSQTSLKLM